MAYTHIYSSTDVLNFACNFMDGDHDARADIEICPNRRQDGMAHNARITLTLSSETAPGPTRIVSTHMDFSECLWMVGHISDNPEAAYEDLKRFITRLIDCENAAKDHPHHGQYFCAQSQTLESLTDWEYTLGTAKEIVDFDENPFTLSS